MPRKHKIVIELPETIFRKLRMKKELDGFGDKTWSDYARYLAKDVRLRPTEKETIQQTTKDSLLQTWMQNFAENLPHILKGKTIADEVPPNPDDVPKGVAIVVGAGPSVWKHKHLDLLAESDFKGVVVATDRMLIPCLKAGVVPNYVLSVDGNREKIIQWYDDPIVDEYGKKIKAFLITCVAHNVLQRCRKAKMQVRWFHPIFDDWRQLESFTRVQKLMTSSKKLPYGVPAMQCGGNTGTACWIMSHALLRRSPIALIGLDLGYNEDTPIEETAYYKSLSKELGDDIQKIKLAFRWFYNPYFKTKAYAEAIFDHYRRSFLELTQETQPWVETINCTEGGTLFGPGIHCMYFKDFLEYCDQPEELRKHYLKG